MFNKLVQLEDFSNKKKNKKIIKILNSLKTRYNSDQLFKSLTPKYNYSFKKKLLNKFKKEKIFKIIGMGGSILGTKSIYLLSNLYSFNGSGFINLVLTSFNKLISSTEPSTLINLFISS